MELLKKYCPYSIGDFLHVRHTASYVDTFEERYEHHQAKKMKLEQRSDSDSEDPNTSTANTG